MDCTKSNEWRNGTITQATRLYQRQVEILSRCPLSCDTEWVQGTNARR
jgi:hypothetical protein